jgi:GxxExxY protein
MESENELSRIILNEAFKVHTELGPGLLESVYEKCLLIELNEIGLFVERQKEIPILYKDYLIEPGFRSDLIVEEKVIIEIKSIESINEVHVAQVLTYLKFTKLKLGLLLNFNVAHLKQGIKRVIR